MSKIPLTLDRKTLVRLLSPLLYKCESTLFRDISRRKKSFPPFEELEGCRKKIFDTQKVIDFYPADIGAAIRRTLARDYDNTGEKPVINTLPELRSLAEDLMVATSARGKS